MAKRVKINDKQQGDQAFMQMLADTALDNCQDLVNSLLFSSDYRVTGGTVAATDPASGQVTVDPGIFVKAGGKFYRMSSTATMNILNGSPSPSGNIWGTGEAAHVTLARKDIIVISYQETEADSALKTFIDPTQTPPQQYTAMVTTSRVTDPTFSVLHGTPDTHPSEPAVPSGFLKLATVDVPASASTITEDDITNNLNADVKSLEQLQSASQPASAFSDLLHSDGVYGGVLNELAVSQTTPASLAVVVATGSALRDGVTASVAGVTTLPVDAASFAHKTGETVSFESSDTQVLQVNGTPPHKIRAATVVVTGFTENTDFTIDYSAGTITRLGTGSIPPAGSVVAAYDYYLPRIDTVQLQMANSTPSVVTGTPAQTPVAPSVAANCLLLAWVAVAEGVTTIVNANVTDERVMLPTMDEVVAARGAYASIDARLLVEEAGVAAATAHAAEQATTAHTVHGIRQGSGNGLDADLLDGQHGLYYLDRTKHTGVQPATSISPQGAGSGLDADTVGGLKTSDRSGTIALLADIVAAVAAIQAAQFQVGDIKPLPHASVPDGWLECDGSAVSRTVYAALFAKISTVHGSGDNTTTFNLPDYRGVGLRGWNHGASDAYKDPDAATRVARHTGGATGDNVGTVQADQNSQHNHTVTDPQHGHGITDAGHYHSFAGEVATVGFGGPGNVWQAASVTDPGTGTKTTGVTVNNAATGVTINNAGGTEARMRNAAVMWVIKTGA